MNNMYWYAEIGTQDCIAIEAKGLSSPAPPPFNVTPKLLPSVKEKLID